MPRPRGTPLIQYMHAELDAALGPDNVELAFETLLDWLGENEFRTAEQLKLRDRAAYLEIRGGRLGITS